MARQKKSRIDGARLAQVLIQVTVAVILLGGGAIAFVTMRQHVLRDLSYPPAPPVLVLKNRPAWMSEALAEQILRGAQPKAVRSALDHEFIAEIGKVLERNAWVRQVKQVRRVYGKAAGDTVELDCEFRAPIALVAFKSDYILVDGEGIRLPEKFGPSTLPRILLGPDGKMNLRIIEGVAAMPPFVDGQKWVGEDLAAGLDLAKLLYGRPFSEEIERINVGNFKGRKSARDAQIVLITKYRSEVRWGEPIKLSFYAELPPVQKLERLALICQKYGRVDGGHSWVDIRLDKVMYPAEEAPVVRGQ
ncbi:MAG TPA: hypothetical protein VGQ99_03535 [Tepidisphaeraceae bacterium]|jgi:hypothetical protein|nr:hypothetical protein [Tepidisphaeraceae bacterium]